MIDHSDVELEQRKKYQAFRRKTREQARAIIGKPVQLKSGGPTMTAAIEPSGDDDDYGILCFWFADQSMQQQRVPLAALEVVELGVGSLSDSEMLRTIDGRGVTPAVTDEMISRFLAWALPDDFFPDCYISFNNDQAKLNNGWPTGTNLLTADQARQMLMHVIGNQTGTA